MMADVLALLMVRKIGVGEQIHIINHLRGDVNPALPPLIPLSFRNLPSALGVLGDPGGKSRGLRDSCGLTEECWAHDQIANSAML